MRKERIKAKVADLVLNEGQLPWLPKNPRQWTRSDLDNLKKSMEADPDFEEDKPILVVGLEDKLLVFGGNMRTTCGKELKRKTMEAMRYYPETEQDYETIKRRAILDNGSFGDWDMDALANEWDDLPLADWGVPSWEAPKEEKEKEDLSDKIDYEFKLEITCQTEAEQEQMYNELTERGFKCRILTL